MILCHPTVQISFILLIVLALSLVVIIKIYWTMLCSLMLWPCLWPPKEQVALSLWQFAQTDYSSTFNSIPWFPPTEPAALNNAPRVWKRPGRNRKAYLEHYSPHEKIGFKHDQMWNEHTTQRKQKHYDYNIFASYINMTKVNISIHAWWCHQRLIVGLCRMLICMDFSGCAYESYDKSIFMS